MIKFDIIIVTYNAKKLLIECIQSIQKNTKDIDYNLTVVINNSTDGTYQYLKRFYGNQLRIIYSKRNLGFSGAANLAIKHTTNPFVVIMDDDIEVTKNWLSRLYRHFKNPKTGIVGGKVVTPDNQIVSAGLLIYPWGRIGADEIDSGQRNYIQALDALAGACWLMKRTAIKKIGKFDERFFPSQLEDVDYCLRARLKGFKVIYDGYVRIIHKNPITRGKQKVLSKNLLLFFKKWNSTLNQFPLVHDSYSKLMAEGSRCLLKYSPNGIDFPFLNKKTTRLKIPYGELFYLGLGYFNRKKYAEAIKKFKKNLISYPHHNLSRYFLLLAYRKSGLVKTITKETKYLMNSLSKKVSLINFYN